MNKREQDKNQYRKYLLFIILVILTVSLLRFLLNPNTPSKKSINENNDTVTLLHQQTRHTREQLLTDQKQKEDKENDSDSIELFKGIYIKKTHDCDRTIEPKSVEHLRDAVIALNSGLIPEVYIFEITNKLTLNIISPQLSRDKWQPLVERLELGIAIYRNRFDLTLNKHYDFNMVVVSKVDEYKAFLDSLNIHLPNSRGVYIHDTNTYVVSYTENEVDELINVAVHESTHRLNHVLIGKMTRYLNEGLAKAFQHIKRVKITLDEQGGKTLHWEWDGYSKDTQIMSIGSLFNSESGWDLESPTIHQLYYSAFKFVQYFFSPALSPTLKKQLQSEAHNKCDIIDNHEEIFQTASDEHDPIFENWAQL